MISIDPFALLSFFFLGSRPGGDGWGHVSYIQEPWMGVQVTWLQFLAPSVVGYVTADNDFALSVPSTLL